MQKKLLAHDYEISEEAYEEVMCLIAEWELWAHHSVANNIRYLLRLRWLYISEPINFAVMEQILFYAGWNATAEATKLLFSKEDISLFMQRREERDTYGRPSNT